MQNLFSIKLCHWTNPPNIWRVSSIFIDGVIRAQIFSNLFFLKNVAVQMFKCSPDSIELNVNRMQHFGNKNCFVLWMVLLGKKTEQIFWDDLEIHKSFYIYRKTTENVFQNGLEDVLFSVMLLWWMLFIFHLQL